MRKATKKQIREWLDEQIKASQIMHKTLSLGPDEIYDRLSNYSVSDEIHIGGRNVRTLAKMFGFELKSEPFDVDDPEYDKKVSFIYKDVKFMGIESADEYKEAGEIQ